MQASEGEPLTLPITLRPREVGGGWRAEIQIGAAWAWGEGETRYQAVTDALHYLAWKLEDLHQDRASLGLGPAADYAALRAWVGEGGGDGSGD
jgi:hypothetical protein